jgi:Domain of unknown function (DUF6250)
MRDGNQIVAAAKGKPCFAVLVLLAIFIGGRGGISLAQDAGPVTAPSIGDSQFALGEKLYSDDFDNDTGRWVSELEQGGNVIFGNGKLEIDVPKGATVWFKPMLAGPVLIQYQAKMISAGGKNDRVSDLNCFWMARDARNPDSLFAVKRSGKFADYNQLLCYYVGVGGNTNTTTRFRRYIGDATTRPLLAGNDLSGKEYLLTPNVSQWITLVACDQLIQFYRDGKKLFEMNDSEPYTSGNFAFRTSQSHLEISHFQVFRVAKR